MQSPKYKLKRIDQNQLQIGLKIIAEVLPSTYVISSPLNKPCYRYWCNDSFPLMRILFHFTDVLNAMGCVHGRISKLEMQTAEILICDIELNNIIETGGSHEYLFYVITTAKIFEIDFHAMRETMKPLAAELARVVFSPDDV